MSYQYIEYCNDSSNIEYTTIHQLANCDLVAATESIIRMSS